MKEIVDKNKCCGCHACLNICPKQAISMVSDNMGFKYPMIDSQKCINCGLCKKVCPILKTEKTDKFTNESYACYNNNIEERLQSSSGGVFVLIAKEILKKHGVVFGASFDKNYNIIHTYIEDEKDLISLMGSKYTQSTIGDSYKKAKQFLDDDRYVLFTGTPCQIEGLKSYLKKDYKKLYTQDIICHGVSSPKVWQKYLDSYKDKRIKKISFRNKDRGWYHYSMKILFDSDVYSRYHQDDLYMKAFLSNVCLRESCYKCHFKKKDRISDLTLADYWGVEKDCPEMMDNKGVSLVLINSEKGKELFNLILNNITYKETNFESAISYNPAYLKSAIKNTNRDDFINDIDNLDIKDLVEKYIPKERLSKRIIKKVKYIIKRIILYLK